MKLIYENFDEKTGKTIVRLADRNGIYQGQAVLSPEDKDHANKYAGGRIAEHRALLQYLKKEQSRTKIELAAIRSLKHDIELHCPFVDNKKLKRRINLKLRDCTQKLDTISELETTIKNTIKKEINVRDNLIKDKINKSFL